MTPEPTDRAPLALFYSYSHKDERHRDALAAHLSLLKHQNIIRDWYDRKIDPGQEWRDQIQDNLDAADIILFLVTADFLASDFVWDEEVARAMARHEEGTARVIPIIVRPVEWTRAPFGRLQALPRDAKPVTIWDNRDSAWLDVARGVAQAVETFAAGLSSEEDARRPSIVTPIKTAPPKGSRKRVSGRIDGHLRRVVYDANNGASLPGEVVRTEGDPATADAAIDETYDGLGATYNFYWDIYDRDSVDGEGMQLEAIVHYEHDWNNVAWNGQRLLLGDGDGVLFDRFTKNLDIIGHELTHGIIEKHTPLVFWEQSGSLLESIADVFGSLVKQYSLEQTAAEADWLVGANLFTENVQGVALRSMKEPGTAYDDPVLGKDPQPAHMRDFVRTEQNNGGVHLNSGIPNRAFYLVAAALGGHAWEKAGYIWYQALQDPQLQPNARFRDFARITRATARRLYGDRSDEALAVKYGWDMVGLKS
jgi:hypothetical protein